jgi:hypothetical protein
MKKSELRQIIREILQKEVITESKTTLQDFKDIVKNKNIKFTPPQQKIVDNLLDGYTIIIMNPHHMSGGEWMWKVPGSDYPRYAGHVYKAFWGVFHTIRKYTGEEIDMNFAFAKN